MAAPGPNITWEEEEEEDEKDEEEDDEENGKEDEDDADLPALVLLLPHPLRQSIQLMHQRQRVPPGPVLYLLHDTSLTLTLLCRSGLLEPVSSEEPYDTTLDSGGHIYERLGRRSGSLPTKTETKKR